MVEAILLCAVILLSFTGCGSGAGNHSVGEQVPAESQLLPETVSTEGITMESKEEQMSEEEKILSIYKKMQDAMVNKDTEYLRSVMGSEVRHITGRTQTIDEWLQDVEDENMKYYRIDVTDPVITIDGDTAVLSCTNVIEARIYGSHGTWTLSGGAYFEKVDGEWIQSVPK